MQSKQYINTLTIIHLAMLMGQVIFVMVTFILITNGSGISDGENSDLRSIFFIAVPILAISGVIASKLIPRQMLPSIKHKDNLGVKLAEYRSISIIKYALMEAGALFAIVAYLLTADYFFLGIAVVMMVIFFLERPSKFKIASDLALSPEEKSRLDNPEASIDLNS